MKLRKALLLFILILVLITVLRERRILTFNYYKSTITAGTSDNWSNSSITLDYKKEDSQWIHLRSRLNDKSNFEQSVKNVPVFVYFEDDDDEKPIDTLPALSIRITSFKPGIVWTPLFKSTSFSATAICSESIEIISENETHFHRKLYNLSGTFDIYGKIDINGICSYTEAKQLVREYMIKQLTMRGNDQVKKL